MAYLGSFLRTGHAIVQNFIGKSCLSQNERNHRHSRRGSRTQLDSCSFPRVERTRCSARALQRRKLRQGGGGGAIFLESLLSRRSRGKSLSCCRWQRRRGAIADACPSPTQIASCGGRRRQGEKNRELQRLLQQVPRAGLANRLVRFRRHGMCMLHAPRRFCDFQRAEGRVTESKHCSPWCNDIKTCRYEHRGLTPVIRCRRCRLFRKARTTRPRNPLRFP